MRRLFAASEAVPFVKTGGLGDVVFGLTSALTEAGDDVRLILPAYRNLCALPHAREVGRLPQTGARLLELELSDGQPRIGLVDLPAFFDRAGNPYLGPDGNPWPDNAARFGAYCRAVAELALDRAGLGWQPDLVHCNDWQTGLVAPYLAQADKPPASVFTIHNLAYQGLFPYADFVPLGLPAQAFTPQALEFYGQLSFIKGGIAYCDRITTVSPRYAQEIRTPEFGCGLDGLLEHRREALIGILNGIDTRTWNPATDPHLARRYDSSCLELKAENKAALKKQLGLPERAGPLVGMIGRLVTQKGIDLVISVLPALFERGLQLVLLGEGERRFEQQLTSLARQYPGRMAVRIGFDEGLAHRIDAGADLFLMPSRFEPCGLNQLYSLRYGTVPVVRSVGGLADSVVDATDQNIAQNRANGVSFDRDNPESLLDAVDRALRLYGRSEIWRRLQLAGLGEDWSWTRASAAYRSVYSEALKIAHGHH